MKAKNFIIEELVPKHIFEKRGVRAWEIIDSRLIETIDAIKNAFPNGTMTINNWFWGGNRNFSCLRTTDSKHYSPTSQHALGKAVDAIFSDYDVNEVRKYIINNPLEFPYVKGIELDVSWLHIDVRNSDTVKTFTA